MLTYLFQNMSPEHYKSSNKLYKNFIPTISQNILHTNTLNQLWSEGSICRTHRWCTQIRLCRNQFSTKNCRHIFILWDFCWQQDFSRPQQHCLWTIFCHIQYGEENHPTTQLPRNTPRCNHPIQTQWYGIMGPQWCLLLVLTKSTKQSRGHVFFERQTPITK